MFFGEIGARFDDGSRALTLAGSLERLVDPSTGRHFLNFVAGDDSVEVVGITPQAQAKLQNLEPSDRFNAEVTGFVVQERFGFVVQATVVELGERAPTARQQAVKAFEGKGPVYSTR